MDNTKFDRETLQELAESEPIPEAARLTVSDYLNMSREEADAKGLYLPWKLAHKQHEKEIKWASFRDEYGRLKNWQQLAAIPKEEAMTMPSDLYQLWSLAQIKKSALSKVVKARNEAIREIRVTANPRCRSAQRLPNCAKTVKSPKPKPPSFSINAVCPAPTTSSANGKGEGVNPA